MQVGDLADGPLADVLRSLSATAATGALHVRRRHVVEPTDAGGPGAAADAILYVRDGKLYAATAPGPRPLLGVRLVAAGAVTRAALEEALESQASELAGWRLGELLVHLGYVDADIVAEFVVEQILDTVAEVSAWPAGGWRFRAGERTREPDALAVDIEDVLSQVHVRRLSWQDLETTAGGAAAVPVRVVYDQDLADDQIPLAQTLLAEVDGRRTLSELATRCGLTTYEAGYVLSHLVESGLVVLGEPALPESGDAADVGVVEDTFALTDVSGAADDLATQLAVLARQAEEARWAAEARQHELLTERRRAATAREIDVQPTVAAAERSGPSDSPAADPPLRLVPLEQPAPYPAVADLAPLWPGGEQPDAIPPAGGQGDQDPPGELRQQRLAGQTIGDPSEFVPTTPTADDQAAIRAALAEVAAGSFAAALDAELAAEAAPNAGPLFSVPSQPVATDYAPGSDALGPVADTAALLRELSFLGVEDAPVSAPPFSRPASARPAVATKPKRKSIFGR